MKAKRNTLLIVLVLVLGLAMAGGTYAWLTINANVSNANYAATSTCFLVDYTDNTQTLSGTLFPSVGPNKGLSGSVSLKVNSSCLVAGKGTLYLHVNSGTSTKFGAVVAAHCENPNTLETLPSYKTSSACTTNGGSWVTTGSALKYAVYDNNTFTGNPLAKGYFSNSLINSEGSLYADFDVTHTQKTYYIYLWLDGYVSDNTYTELPFSGYVLARATQTDSPLPSGYQAAEYIHFSGTQYVNTGVAPSTYNGNYALEIEERHAQNNSNLYIMGTTTGKSNALSRGNIRIDSGVTVNAFVNKSDNSGALSDMTATSKLVVNDLNYIKFTVNMGSNTRRLVVNGYEISNTTTAFVSKSTTTFRIGGYGTTASFVGDIHSVKIYGNGNLVRYFIPCTKDGTVGFYDMVTDNFFTGSGTGSLTTAS